MRKLLKTLRNRNEPKTVPVRIETYSTENGCFLNVLEKVSIDRGQIIYGWKIHHSPFLEEAERHAIWSSPNGELVDITPNLTDADEILFLEEDKGWVYDQGFYDNVRVNITDNPVVDDLILLKETATKLWQTSTRKSKTIVTVSWPVGKAIEYLNALEVATRMFIYSNNNEDSNCHCGRPMSYKNCHGLDLKSELEELLKRVCTSE